jgi:DNA-binding CsgD family transcriptional regulator
MRARSLLAKYLGGLPRRRDALPELLQRWIGRPQMQLNHSGDVPPCCEPFIVHRHDGRLSVRLFRDHAQSLLLLEESLPAPGKIDGFSLTRREAEVLAWLSRGKTNRDISAILGTSPRTVQKHVEHIFQKLGVETRTAAAAKVLAQTGEPGAQS